MQASQTTALLWSVVGGADFGTVTAETNGARYTAPSRPPAGGVLVRAASSLDPNRSSTTPVTVLPGIRIVATADGERLLAGYLLRRSADRISSHASADRCDVHLHYDH